MNKYEELNKTKTIYLAYDCELFPMLITANLNEIKAYCKANECNYSTYPVNCYTDIN